MTPQRWSQIKEVFFTAREKQREERSAYLDSACGDDRDLRGELERLLAKDNQPSLRRPPENFLESVVSQLAPGQSLAQYRVEAKVGEGGMGAVYRAYDTRLRRQVALKVLPPERLADPESKQRLLREARAASALNHPNIVTVHEIGTEGDVDFITMEFVEGKGFKELIPAKGLPPEKALGYAVQIAGGLAKAHAAGIIHRDLKPANIMLTPDGVVKLLDFGLARQVGRVKSETASLTVETEIAGTPAYMSPEQARGEELDARTDLFSFGCVFYEMVTGRAAFSGASSVLIFDAILHQNPTAPVQLNPHCPSELQRVLNKALEKDCDMRYQSAADLRTDLMRLKRDMESERAAGVRPGEAYTSVGIEPVKTTNSNRIWQWIGIPACVLLAAATALLLRRDVGQDISRHRYTPFAINPEGQSSPAWSPDGRSITYAGIVNGYRQVFVRSLDSPESTQLTSNREYGTPRWSPDSKRILYFAPGLDNEGNRGGTSLYSIAAVGGEPELLAPLPDDTVTLFPDYQFAAEISPDNQTLVLFGRREGEKATVLVSSPLGSRFRQYEPAPFASKAYSDVPHLRFAPNGQKLLLIRTGDSGAEEGWLLPYPPGKSPPQRVLTHFPVRKTTRDFSWMPDNRHVVLAVSTGSTRDGHLWMADTESDDSYQITDGIGTQTTVAISPYGRQIIYSEAKQDLDVISVSLLDGKSKKLIATDEFERMAAWSAGTDKLAYVTDRNGPSEIWVRSADGSDHPLVTHRDFPGSPSRLFMDPVVSPDGKRVIFTRESDGGIRTWIMSLSGGAPQRLDDSANDTEFAGTWSPDGRRFAELALSGSTWSLAVVKVGSREKPVILRDHVLLALPDWSPTGEWLTFFDNSGWNLISPDGKSIKPLGEIATSYLAFSKDGKLLYGIREENDKTTLFSLDITTLKATDLHELGKDLAPASDLIPGIRFSLTPDGKSITYSTQVDKSNLWILEGFRQPGLLSRWGLDWSR